MIPQDSYNSKSDSDSAKTNRYNQDAERTNTNRSAKLTGALRRLDVHEKAFDTLIEAGNLDPDIRQWDRGQRAAYFLGGRDERVRLNAWSDPYQRSKRYRSDLGAFITTRIDTCKFTLATGRDNCILNAIKRKLQRDYGLLFQDTHRKQKGYNHCLDDVKYGCHIDYSLESDKEGSVNNKGKFTLTLQGSFMESLEVSQVYALFIFLHEHKAECVRIDARMLDHSNFVIPRQLFEWCRSQEETYNRVPITGIRSTPKYIADTKGNDTFNIGSRKSGRFMRIYDTRYKHGVDATCWELELKHGHANQYFNDLIDEFRKNSYMINDALEAYKNRLYNERGTRVEPRIQERGETVDLISVINEITEILRENKSKLINDVIEEFMHSFIASAVLSAFKFTEGRERQHTHLDRTKEASWYTEFKSQINDLRHYRTHVPKEKTTIQKARKWMYSWLNTTVLIGASIAGINVDDLKQLISTDLSAATKMLLDNLSHEMHGMLREHLKEPKFYRSQHAKLLNAA